MSMTRKRTRFYASFISMTRALAVLRCGTKIHGVKGSSASTVSSGDPWIDNAARSKEAVFCENSLCGPMDLALSVSECH